MLNMISAELYKTAKRLYSKLFIGICVALVLIFSIMLRLTFTELKVIDGREAVFGTYLYIMVVPFFLAIVTSDIVFSDENKHNTMKNVVAFGYTRTQIYFSKLAAAVINFLVTAFIVLVATVLITILLFPAGEHWGLGLEAFLLGFVSSLPLWLSEVALCIAVWCNIKSSTFGTFAVVFISYILPKGLDLMGLITDKEIYCKISNWFPASHLSDVIGISLVEYTSNGAGGYEESYLDSLSIYFDIPKNNCMYGFIFFGLCMIVGWLFFRRREVR